MFPAGAIQHVCRRLGHLCAEESRPVVVLFGPHTASGTCRTPAVLIAAIQAKLFPSAVFLGASFHKLSSAATSTRSRTRSKVRGPVIDPDVDSNASFERSERKPNARFWCLRCRTLIHDATRVLPASCSKLPRRWVFAFRQRLRGNTSPTNTAAGAVLPTSVSW